MESRKGATRSAGHTNSETLDFRRNTRSKRKDSNLSLPAPRSVWRANDVRWQRKCEGFEAEVTFNVVTFSALAGTPSEQTSKEIANHPPNCRNGGDTETFSHLCPLYVFCTSHPYKDTPVALHSSYILRLQPSPLLSAKSTTNFAIAASWTPNPTDLNTVTLSPERLRRGP